MDDDDSTPEQSTTTNRTTIPTNQEEITLDDEEPAGGVASSPVPEVLRAQLPAAFARPAPPSQRQQSGQPTPPDVTNTIVRFLALDKCLPGRKFLQLLEAKPYTPSESTSKSSAPTLSRSKAKFEYDPEWMAITRVFAHDLVLGDRNARPSQDLGEAHYRPLIEREQEWIHENVVKKGKLAIPENFILTAPAFTVGSPEIVNEGPLEYNNPQMQQFCELIGIENKFFATEEERDERMRRGPAPAEERRDGRFGRRARGGSRGGGRGPRGGGRGWGRGRGW